jgi:hypothetical protein
MKFRTLNAFVLTLATVFLLAGCGGGGGGTTPRSTVKVINAIPDLGTSLETQINGLAAGTTATYLADNAFFSIEPADVDLAIKETGAVEDLDIIANVFNSDASYIVAGMGIKNFGTEFEKRPRIGLFEVNRAEPNGSKARVFVLNALTGPTEFPSPTLDFQDGDLPRFPFTDIEFSKAKVLTVDTGTYTYEARANDSELVYASSSLTFESGKVYFAVVSGIVNGSGASAPTIRVFELPVVD